MLNGLSTLLRLTSRITCLIVVVSFALFALDQTSSASEKQQNEVSAIAPPSSRTTTPTKSSTGKQASSVRNAIDEASSTLTSPFKGVTAGSHNQWAIRGVDLLLALLAYGFGLGFLARMVRVRV
jgi:hypothetical protein